MDRATRGRSDGGRWKCVPHTDSFFTRPRNDVLPVRRVSNRLDHVGMPLERLAGRSTSLGIPDSNGAIVGSGNDVAPIGRVGNGLHHARVPLERIADGDPKIALPDSSHAPIASADDVLTIRTV